MKKWPFLHLLFFGNIFLENVFHDILELKNAFLGFETRSSKSRKIEIFLKRTTHGFCKKKWLFLHLLFLGKIAQENVFYEILELKNPFLSYKNKKFTKSKN